MAPNDANGDTRAIKPSEIVRVTRMGDIVEVQHMETMNRTCRIKKLDADRYVDITSGEIKEFERAANRAESEESMRATFKRLRYRINANFSGSPNEQFWTLTYAENMQDRERLDKDFNKFMKRLRYRLGIKSADMDYIRVAEPQERGAWHLHVLVRFNDREAAYIPSEELAELWKHGFVKIQRLTGIDNIGAYLTAYLSDIELPEGRSSEGRNVVIREVDGKEKKFIKGGRLWRYPPNMKLYTCSRGIKEPERVDMRYDKAKKIVGSKEPHFKKSYSVEKDDYKNTITYEEYNMKRRELDVPKASK